MSDTKSKQGKVATDDMIAALAEGLGMPPTQVSRKAADDQPARGENVGAATGDDRGPRKGKKGKKRHGGQGAQPASKSAENAQAQSADSVADSDDDSLNKFDGRDDDGAVEAEGEISADHAESDSGMIDNDNSEESTTAVTADGAAADGEAESKHGEEITVSGENTGRSQKEIELEILKMELEKARLELEKAKLAAASGAGASAAAGSDELAGSAESGSAVDTADDSVDGAAGYYDDDDEEIYVESKSNHSKGGNGGGGKGKNKGNKAKGKEQAAASAKKAPVLDDDDDDYSVIGHFSGGSSDDFNDDSIPEGVDEDEFEMLAKRDQNKLVIGLVGVLVAVIVIGLVFLVYYGNKTTAKLDEEGVEHAGMWDVLTHFESYRKDVKDARLRRSVRETQERTPIYGFLQLVCDPPQADIYVRCEPADDKCNNVGTPDKPQWSDHFVPTAEKKECTQHVDCRDCRQPTEAEIYYEIYKAGDQVCTFADDECREGMCWQPLRTAIEAQKPTEVQNLYIGTVAGLDNSRKYHVTLRKPGWLPKEFTVTHENWNLRPDPRKEDRVFSQTIALDPDPNAPEEIRVKVDEYIQKNRVVEGAEEVAKTPAKKGARRR